MLKLQQSYTNHPLWKTYNSELNSQVTVFWYRFNKLISSDKIHEDINACLLEHTPSVMLVIFKTDATAYISFLTLSMTFIVKLLLQYGV